MAYKRFFHRNGKTFGPYYYESYRDSSGKVRKKYVGTTDPKEKQKPAVSSIASSVTPTKTTARFAIGKPVDYRRFFFVLGFIFIIVLSLFIIGFLFSNFSATANVNTRFSGFAISENGTSLDMSEVETIVQNFDTSDSKLSVKEPVSSGLFGEAVTRNKNKRMDFQLSEGNVRLYFDLLNYSEFVEGVAGTSNILTEVNVNKTTLDIFDNSTISESNITIANETIIEIINQTQEINATEEIKEQENITENPNQPATEQTPVETSPAEINTTETTETSSAGFGITGNIIRFFNLIGRVIGIDTNETSSLEVNQTNDTIINQVNEISTKEVDLNEIKQSLDNLNESEINVISDNSVISAENFDISVNSSKINDKPSEYKWGYKVKLNDLKFMAKVEVTSNGTISKYNDYTLKIGKRNLLSFEDLVKAGYVVKIESPALGIPANITIKIPEKNITVIENMTREENFSIINVNASEINMTTGNFSEINLTEINVTIPVSNISNEVIENITEINVTEEQTQPAIETNTTGQTPAETTPAETTPAEQKANEKETKQELKQEQKETKKGVKEDKKSSEISVQQPAEQTPTEASPSEAPVETPAETTPSETAPAEIPVTENSITAQVIKFIKLTGNVVFGTGNAIIGFAGRVTGTEENATVIEDISYANTITIYIERDFSESDNVTQGELGGQAGSEAINLSNLIAGKDYEDTERTSSPVSPNHEGFEDLDNDGRVSIGDIINLDPTLIIIPMTGAEELDSNRSYIRDIYNETSVKDDNYVLINNSNYVRATFSQALGKNNDITVFARAKTDNSVVINGAEIPYEIYQKKKRIDEINRILNGS